MDGEAQPIADFIEPCKRLTVADFTAHGVAFLLRHNADTALRAPDGPQRTWLAPASDETKGGKAPPPRPRYKDFVVYQVRSTGRSSGGFITVGRTRNNDVVIFDVSLSRFHASFRRGGDRLELQDAGSRNGTRVNDEPAPTSGSGRRVALASNDRIRFGTVEVTFLYGPDFHAFVRRLF